MSTKTSGERRGRPATFAARRASILRVAVEVINRRGVRAMTMAEVARALELVPSAVGYYFRRKEALAAACFLQAVETFDGLVDQARAADGAEPRLERFLAAYARLRAAIDTGQADPVAYFNDVRAIGDESVYRAYAGLFRDIRDTIIGPAFPDGGRLERNSRAHLLITQLYWAEAWLRRYEPSDYERMMAAAADILTHGLANQRDVRPLGLPAPKPPADGLERASREAFFRAATELINEKGFKGASVKEISAKLNVTHGSFYHYNQYKDDLVRPCFERTLAMLRDHQREVRKVASNGLERVATFAGVLARGNVNGGAPMLRTSALSSVPEPLQVDLLQRYDRIVAGLAADITDGMRDGSIRIVDPTVAANLVISLINASTELPTFAPGIRPHDVFGVYVRPLLVGLFRGP